MELLRSGADYREILRKRAGRSKVYSRHQLIGLLLAELLRDPSHKALYIRLAKRQDAEYLLQIAKEVSSRKNVKNKGAYFMKVITRAQIIPQWKSSLPNGKKARRSSARRQRTLFSLTSRKKRSKA